MIYTFKKFSLDSQSRELSYRQELLPLTKQLFDLLFLFVSNPQKVFSKDDIIDQVWEGKYVTENSIDKSVSKLRKILSRHSQDTYIKTAYGEGFIFVAEVIKQEKQATQVKRTNKVRILPYLGVIAFVLLLAVFFFNKSNKVQGSADNPLLLILSSEEATENSSWLHQSGVDYIDQILGLTDAVRLKDYTKKPKYQNRQQYINNQWKISPQLKVVTTKVSQQEGLYTVDLNIVDKLANIKTQTFSRQNLSLAIRDASKWLAYAVNGEGAIEKIDSLIPNNSYLVELYMHGLASFGKGEADKAENYFELCLQEKPDFHLAKLELARVKTSLGKMAQGLALLDTLDGVVFDPQLDIEVQSVRGLIFNIQGKDEKNRGLYLSVLEKYNDKDYAQLNQIKYNLSFTYTKLTEFEKALVLLTELEASIDESIEPVFLAHVTQKKASILQKMGHIQEAKLSAEKSLLLFSKLGDLLGEAKIHTTLARISTHQSKYKESVHHLEQSLAICKSLDYKLGIGATLNELIYILMVQGHFTKALELNQEMETIAIEIGYNAMLQISKQFAVDIRRTQKQWLKSEIYLKEHLRLAQSVNNKSALLANKLLSIDLALDQDKSEGVEALISGVQSHIDQTKEVRLQPRLNKQLARLYLLNNQTELAMSLLLETKELAKKTEDGEVIIGINNILAGQYLLLNQPHAALAVLEGSFEHNPVPYPFLLLKARANEQLGNHLQALDFANECKVRSNEWWTLQDDRYLSGLIKLSSVKQGGN